MNLRILSVIGTRPEAIKLAPVIKIINQIKNVDSIVCLTAQHRQMLDQVLKLFKIQPDIDLDVMIPNQSLSQLSATIFSRLEPVFIDLKPDWVMVQGDTTTVMVASLLAFYNQIKVAHVEAGLRTGNKLQPFPEEINRRIAGLIADLHFAPTEMARQNLLREGVESKKVILTGNPVVDSLQYVSQLPAPKEIIDLFINLGLNDEPFPRLVLVTAHRRENIGKPLEEICSALKFLAEYYGSSIQIVYPVHLNPNVQMTVYRLLDKQPNITLLQPLNYLELVHLMKRATLVLTDSGGIQEEAPSFRIPVLVLREVTERPEGVNAGMVRLVGTNRENIIHETRRLLDNAEVYEQMIKAENPYGDGKAAQRIVEALMNYQG